MSVILTGNLAMLLLRFGAVDPLEPALESPDDVLERATVADGAIGRIGNSLQHGAANRWLRERGLDLMAQYRGSGFERADMMTLETYRVQEPLFRLAPIPPIEFVVSRAGGSRRHERVKVHRCSLNLPEGFLLRAREELDFGPDAFIAHPALSLVIAARGRSMPQLVEYAMGLCGSYAFVDEDSWRCVFDVPALTRRDRLVRNVRALAWRWDTRHAASSKRPPALTNTLEALEFVLDRSGSPLETKVATLLTLSEKFGGYGFTGLELNCRFGLSEVRCALTNDPHHHAIGSHNSTENSAHHQASELSNCIDGWFDSAHIGFEYDRDEFQDLLSESKLTRDWLHQEAVELAGGQILTITRDLLCDSERFDRFYEQLRDLAGQHERSVNSWTSHRHDTLRATLGLSLLTAKKPDCTGSSLPRIAA